MNCPQCNGSISFLRAKEEFQCPKCNAVLVCRDFDRLNNKTFVISAVISILIGLVFKFSLFAVILYSLLFIMIVIWFNKKLTCELKQKK